jgi:hypothetical protein
MVELSQLWLPILLSGVAVFFISFLMWMVSPHHRSDWKPLPNETRVMDTLRELGVGGGQYAMPHCSDPSKMKDPEWMAMYNRGPSGHIILKPEGPVSMGKAMAVSGLFNLVTAAMVAYAATLALPAGVENGLVLRFVFVVAFLANSFGLVWGSIWFGRTWSSTLKEMGDGLVYAAATAGIFLAFWPAA